MDVAEIRRLITDEVARTQLQKQLAPPPKRDLKWLRHPILLSLVAFTLTGIVGRYIDVQLEARSRDRALIQSSVSLAETEETQSVQILNEFVHLAYQRTFFALRLRDALIVGDGDLAREFRAKYDQAYEKWAATLPQNLLMLRELAGLRRGRSDYEKAVSRTLSRSFARLSACVLYAYETSRREDFKKVDRRLRHWRCRTGEWWRDGRWVNKMQRIEQRIRTCTYAIMSNLFYQVRTTTERTRAHWRVERTLRPVDPPRISSDWTGRIRAQLEQTCPKFVEEHY